MNKKIKLTIAGLLILTVISVTVGSIALHNTMMLRQWVDFLNLKNSLLECENKLQDVEIETLKLGKPAVKEQMTTNETNGDWPMFDVTPWYPPVPQETFPWLDESVIQKLY